MRKNEYVGALNGYFHHENNSQPIIIEYRVDKRGEYPEYTVEAKIYDTIYKFEAREFFGAVAEFIDGVPLPSDSYISIPHRILCQDHQQGTTQYMELIEFWHPYTVRNGATVLYSLSVTIEEKVIKTKQYSNFARVMEELGRSLNELGKNLIVCYFCVFLMDENQYGGTDYRMDKLYCFKDAPPEIFQEVKKYYPFLEMKAPHLLDEGVPDVSALHACGSFTKATEKRRI